MSEIRANSITDAAGTGAPNFPNGLSGSGASLTSLPAGQLTGALPALDGSALTNLPAPTSAQVGTAMAGLAYGDVGTYAYLNINTTANLSEGSTFSGSSLSPAGSYVTGTMVAGTGQTSGAIRGAATLAGTWRLMGSNNNAAAGKQNVFLRIS